ncbi:hypothetical protein BDZ91DRAFT_792982 [Kalaharituber pfeilii]|nr:hypothetical protein BDZ91DRAFT_792982 [Kalaharituber pfeilii]
MASKLAAVAEQQSAQLQPQQGPPQVGAPQGGLYPQPPQSSYSQQPPPSQHLPYQVLDQQYSLHQKGNADTFYSILRECVDENNLHQLYTDSKLQEIANRLAIPGKNPVGRLCDEWKVPDEIGFDFVKQALYDVVFLLDDSGSIRFSELEEELRGILDAAAFATSLFDDDGFSVRFLNHEVGFDNIRTDKEREALWDGVKFRGETPLAGSLKKRILDPMADPQKLRKPLHVIIITDGVPTDSINQEFQKNIVECMKRFSVRDKNGNGVKDERGTVAIQIAQIGNDHRAMKYLQSLDQDSKVGGFIDCTSNFELESTQYAAKGISLTKYHWYCKLMMGAIDKSVCLSSITHISGYKYTL